MKLKKPTVIQSRESHPLNKSGTDPYYQNNNWTQTGRIHNKNDMPRSYTLLNNKDSVIKTKQYLVKIENDNDMDSDAETESKTRYSLACQQPNLEMWTNLKKMQLNFKKHRDTQLNQERKVIRPC